VKAYRSKVWFFALLFSNLAHAWAPDFQSARTLSLGQGGRAGALLTDTITLNPSMLGFQPAIAMSGSLFWHKQGSSFRGYNGGIIDGKNEYFSAGFSYTRGRQYNFFHLATAKKVLPWLSVGAHGKRYSSRSNTEMQSAKGVTGYDGGVSATLAFPKDYLPLPLTIALTSDNLLNKDGREESVGPRQIAVGGKTNIHDILLIYLDYLQYMPKDTASYPKGTLGLELALSTDIFLRGSLFGFKERGWSGGIGWVGPKIALNYGYQRQTQPVENRGFSHGISMDIYL
jgi:hypothetical protein